ncbi:pyruvate decarboxylase [Daejeonia sp. YH14]|uniref:pyruvate decarboxylase n=1 Tax=Daejeonia sp. YH14 TaxID=3439042 RepID=UPI003F49093A
MKKKNLAVVAFLVVAGGIVIARAQSLSANDAVNSSIPEQKVKKVLYFNPQVYPDLDEIKEPTNTAFFSAVSDEYSSLKRSNMLRADVSETDEISAESIREYCRNNNADFAIVPKVKYFKVGIGKYVFSNQVVVSMKLYDAKGNFLTETQYDTYKKNMRMLGSAENSVKIGTKGAIREIIKKLRKSKKISQEDL